LIDLDAELISSTGEEEGERVVFLILADGVGGVTEVEALVPIVALVSIVEALVAEVDALKPDVETIVDTEVALLPLPLPPALPLGTTNALPMLATV